MEAGAYVDVLGSARRRVGSVTALSDDERRQLQAALAQLHQPASEKNRDDIGEEGKQQPMSQRVFDIDLSN